MLQERTERNLTLWERVFVNISLVSCFCFSLCWGNCLDIPGEHKCRFPPLFSSSESLFSGHIFFSRLQFVECFLCWFYITSLRLPTIRFQCFERAGSPPLKLPLIPTMWQNTGLINNPTWQELFLWDAFSQIQKFVVHVNSQSWRSRLRMPLTKLRSNILFTKLISASFHLCWGDWNMFL